MIEKIKRPQKFNNQEMQIPRNIQELMQRYDLDNNDIRDYLDYIINLFLPLTGGTITGNITYNMFNNTGTPLEIYGGGGANGLGLSVKFGAGGTTIIQAGEGGETLKNEVAEGAENLWLVSDGYIGFYTNTQDYENKAGMYLNTAGSLHPLTPDTGTIGTVNYPWRRVYATQFHSAHANGIYLDQYGNIYTKNTLTSGNWRIQNGSNIPLKVEFSDDSIRTRAIHPQATETYDLGSVNYRWKKFYVQEVLSTVAVCIPKNSSSGYGLCNADGKSIIRDHGNNNITVDATGGTLYLGYANTTGLNFMNGKATMDSSGVLELNNIKSKAISESLILSNSTYSYFGNGSGASGVTTALRGNTVRLYAHTSGAIYLGQSGSTAITSDENLKDIFDIDDRYIDFFNNLKPVNYVYKNNGHRKHFGFGARQVEQSLLDAGLTTEDFAGVLKDKDVTISADENGTGEDIRYDELYSLRYEEFISLNTLMIQKAFEEINNLKKMIGG